MKPCLGEQQRPLRAGPFEIAETRHRDGLALPRHAHETACVHVVVDGIYQETTLRGIGAHPSGTVLFKPPGEPHWNRFDGGGSRTVRVEVPAPLGDRLGARLGPVHTTGGVVLDAAFRLVTELRHADDLTPMSAEGLCLELLADLGRARASGATGSRGAARDLAERARGMLDERHREPLRFGAIAEELGVDRSHLARAFRARHRCTMGGVPAPGPRGQRAPARSSAPTGRWPRSRPPRASPIRATVRACSGVLSASRRRASGARRASARDSRVRGALASRRPRSSWRRGSRKRHGTGVPCRRPLVGSPGGSSGCYFSRAFMILSMFFSISDRSWTIFSRRSGVSGPPPPPLMIDWISSKTAVAPA